MLCDTLVVILLVYQLALFSWKYTRIGVFQTILSQTILLLDNQSCLKLLTNDIATDTVYEVISVLNPHQVFISL